MLLAIDTSTRNAGVALGHEGRVLSSHSWFSTVNHTVELMPAVAQILESRGLKVAGLDGVAVALGPGGFSALRVGMSVAKGLAAAGRKPIIGVGSLDMEAHAFLESGLPVCAVLDAGRGEWASAHFGIDGLRIRDDLVGSPEEILEAITGMTLFCGEGVDGRGELIKERLGSWAVVVDGAAASLRLHSLVSMAQDRLDQGDVDDLATLQPEYLRMPSIGVPKRRDRLPQGP